MERFELENADYRVSYDLERPEEYISLYIIGAFIICAAAMVSLVMFLFTKRRTLMAYGVQSTMPVNKEAIEQYTPTVAKAAGDVAGSVAEGVTHGAKKEDHS